MSIAPAPPGGTTVDQPAPASARGGVTHPEATGTGPVREGAHDGDRVGRYVVLGELGVGGMGRVLHAYDPRLRREVAIKMLHRRDQPSGDVVEEARAMAKLRHPNIVAVFDVDVVGGEPFLAMEFVEGETLRTWMGEAARPWPEVWPTLRQAGLGLVAAHEGGLVHRDFKPRNVLIGNDGRVQVTDFGVAIDERDATGGSVGTPAYMAPEQHDGEPADARADQYAFCVTLWEALTGDRPFEGEDLAEAKRGGTLPDAAEIRALPAAVRAALVRGLSPEPADRHASMRVILSALDHRRSPLWWWGAGAAVIAVAGASIGVVRWQAAAALERRCDGEAGALTSVWNADAAARMRAVFERSKAAATFDRTQPWLDRYAETWATVRRDSCVAHGRGQADASLSAVAAACFDEQAARFEATVSALSADDGSAVHRAIKAAAGLPDPQECSDVSALRVRAPLPEDPSQRERLAELSARRAAVSAAVAAGRMGEAAKDAEALVDEARALDWAPAVVDTLVRVAETREKAGDYAGAEAAAVEAFQQALAADYDVAALDACARLVYVVGYGLSKPAAGLEWAATGEAVASRLGFGVEHPRRTALLNATAVVQWAAGDYEASKRAHEQALAIKRSEFGPEHPVVAISLENYGITLASMDDLDGAQAAFEEMLAIVEATYGDDHAMVTEGLTRLGTLAAMRGETEQARDYLERALTRTEAERGGDHLDVALVLINLAGTELRAGRAEQALAHATRASGMVRPEHPFRLEAVLTLGNAQLAAGKAALAEQTLGEAETLAGALPAEHPDRQRVAQALVEARDAQE